MIKNKTQIEAEVDGKKYHLLCDHDSPIAHVKEALFQFIKYMGHLEEKIASDQKQEEFVDKKEEVEKEEPK